MRILPREEFESLTASIKSEAAARLGVEQIDEFNADHQIMVNLITSKYTAQAFGTSFKKRCCIIAGIAITLMLLFFWLCPWRYEIIRLMDSNNGRGRVVFVADRLFNTVRAVVHDKEKGSRELIRYSF